MENELPKPDVSNLYPKIVDVERNARLQPKKSRVKQIFLRLTFVVLIFVAGFGSGFLAMGQSSQGNSIAAHKAMPDTGSIVTAINPTQGFVVPARFGDVGPKVVKSGAINLSGFEQLFQQSNQPLSTQELAILAKGSQDQVVINQQNARFLLNFFWALGLVNKNPILDNGTIQQRSNGKIDGFASTGGWTLGQKPVTELFSSAAILPLTEIQQALVDEVARAVYRPCCDNPTDFPDCNHGMAMLGLLELMASQNATADEMFAATKNVNAFWFPQQTLEQALYFKSTQNIDYASIDPQTIVGVNYSSGSGFQQTHQWLAQNGLLNQGPNSGNNCGV